MLDIVYKAFAFERTVGQAQAGACDTEGLYGEERRWLGRARARQATAPLPFARCEACRLEQNAREISWFQAAGRSKSTDNEVYSTLEGA